jgi:diphosphomevalonate decarboxylase
MKATAVAPANIAFIKYWGARDLDRAVPRNPSISMTLRACHTRCTVEHLPGGSADEVLYGGGRERLRDPGPAFADRVRRHLDGIRAATGAGGAFRVATWNSFPSAAGLASSASGFAALTLAAARAAGADFSHRDLSSLARLSGSGSAARSVLGGYVEWPAGDGEDGCHARPLASHDHWDLRDLIALVEAGPKATSSREGHRRAPTSPYFEARQALLPARLRETREAIAGRDLARLGPVLEEEAIDLHLIAMSSRPPIFYWHAATLGALEAVRRLRDEGAGAWATMDAGPNVHVICEAGSEERVAAALREVPGVREVIRDGVGPGPRFVPEHLF